MCRFIPSTTSRVHPSGTPVDSPRTSCGPTVMGLYNVNRNAEGHQLCTRRPNSTPRWLRHIFHHNVEAAKYTLLFYQSRPSASCRTLIPFPSYERHTSPRVTFVSLSLFVINTCVTARQRIETNLSNSWFASNIWNNDELCRRRVKLTAPGRSAKLYKKKL
jgi:hypothetical protein